MATIWVAVIVWAARLAAIYSGSWIGAWLGGTPADLRRRIWQGMITQVRNNDGALRQHELAFPSRRLSSSCLDYSVAVLQGPHVLMCVGWRCHGSCKNCFVTISNLGP